MFVLVINREVGGHVENMELHKIHVKFVRILQGKDHLRGLDIEEMAVKQDLFIPCL